MPISTLEQLKQHRLSKKSSFSQRIFLDEEAKKAIKEFPEQDFGPETELKEQYKHAIGNNIEELDIVWNEVGID